MRLNLCIYFFFEVVKDFYWEDVYCYYNCFGKLFINKRLENKNVIIKLVTIHGVKKIVLSAYHLQFNMIIKHGHKLIVYAFSKISTTKSINWV